MDKEIEEGLKRKFEESKDEKWGCLTANPVCCYSCYFSDGEPPFADGPEKAHCMIYDDITNWGKPDNVYFYGEECEHWIEKD